MALSDDQILDVAATTRLYNHALPAIRFARSIDAEVRKQDDALIQQLVDALEGYRRNHNDTQPCDAERAGRARLGRPHD